jgi:hypothetical protein
MMLGRANSPGRELLGTEDSFDALATWLRAALLARVGRRELADDGLRMVGAIALASTRGNAGQADRMLAIVLNGLR